MASGQGINIGGIYADLDIQTGNLDRGLAKGRAALAAIDKEVRQLQSDFDKGAIGLQSYTDRMAALSNTQAELSTRMMAAYGATKSLNTGLELVTKNANAMVAASNRMGQGLMQLGYIADDLQYGFSGVVNNIAPLVGNLTGNAGLAVAAQITAVAGYQLYVHWDQLKDAMGVGAVRTEAEEMEALAKATSRTADEQERLNKYKEKQAEIAKMLGGKSKEQIATEAAVQDIYNEAGPGKIAGALAAQMTPKASPEDKAKGVEAYGNFVNQIANHGEDSPEAQKALQAFLDLDKQIAKKLQDEGGKRAADLMHTARQADAEGEQARRSIITKLGDPSNPLYGVAMQLQSAGPDARANAEKVGNLAEEKARREDADKKERDEDQAKADRGRERSLGRLGFLEEQHVLGQTTADEEGELSRLRDEQDARKGREADTAKSKAVRDAKDKAPGIDKQAELLATMVAGGAISPDKARDMIAKRLADSGVGPMARGGIADEILDTASDKVQKDAIGRAMNEHTKTSQVFDANSLAAQFQASVGGDETKRTNSILEDMRKTLDQMVKNGWVPIVK